MRFSPFSLLSLPQSAQEVPDSQQEDMLLGCLELGTHLCLQALSSLMGHSIIPLSLLIPVPHGRN